MKASRTRTFLAAGAALAFATLGAGAQTPYPCQTVKLVSPYPAGGTTDILARLIAQHMQPVSYTHLTLPTKRIV